MNYYHWLGIDAELYHLGKPDHEHRREETVRAVGLHHGGSDDRKPHHTGQGGDAWLGGIADLGLAQLLSVGSTPVDEEGLECTPNLLLYAFELAGPYATGNSNCKKLQNRKELALGLVDWAWAECDRGMKILELTNKLADAEAEIASLRKGAGGTFYLP